MKKANIMLAAILGTSLASVSAIELNEKVELNGQLRTRTQYDVKAPGTTFQDGVGSSEMRTRLGVMVKPQEGLNFQVEFQDSRVAGNETPAVAAAPHTSSLSNTQGVDLHQAWVEIEALGAKTKIGRQKFKIGSQRLVSSLEWHPNARVLDGVSNTSDLGINQFTAWGFWVHNNNPTVAADGNYLLGLHDNMKFSDALSLELYTMYDKSQVGGVGFTNWDLLYLGQRVTAKFGKLSLEEEIIAQTGETFVNTQKEAASTLAFQTALRLEFAPTKEIKLGLGHDMMTGDSKPGDDNNTTYMNNHAFAHAYYGWMDYVLVNKANTSNKGVQDYRVDVSHTCEHKVLKLSYHHLTSAVNEDPLNYGDEIDLELHLKLIPKANIVLGAAMFIPSGESGSPIGADASENGYYFYFMPVFNF